MTMNDLKPSAVTEFNRHISDEYAREYFANAFDLWGDSPSNYTADDNAYKIVIMRHVHKIRAEIKKAAAVLEVEYTKRIKGLNTALTAETTESNKHTVGKINDDRTITDGEFTQTARQYPDGYTGSADAAYMRAQTHDGEYTQTHAYETNNVETAAENSEKGAETAQTAETDETDIIASVAQLDAYAPSYALIERCVFDFVGDTIIC